MGRRFSWHRGIRGGMPPRSVETSQSVKASSPAVEQPRRLSPRSRSLRAEHDISIPRKLAGPLRTAHARSWACFAANRRAGGEPVGILGPVAIIRTRLAHEQKRPGALRTIAGSRCDGGSVVTAAYDHSCSGASAGSAYFFAACFAPPWLSGASSSSRRRSTAGTCAASPGPPSPRMRAATRTLS